jgi:intraflagellar transport protein 88
MTAYELPDFHGLLFIKKAPGDTGGYRTSGGRPIGTAVGGFGGPLKTGRMGTALGTAFGVSSGDGSGPRPMTSVRAAGFSSRGRSGMVVGQAFDPFNQAGKRFV